MKTRAPTSAKAASTHSFTPAPRGLLHHACACGARAGLDGQCAACRQARLIGEQRPLVSAKLHINRPGGHFEQEADTLAEQVMRMPEPGAQRASTTVTQSLQDGTQAGSPSDRAPALTGRTDPMIRSVRRSAGRPLDPAIQSSMESRFGHDFSRVRVHTDSTAAATARVFNARAFTVGHDIAFGADQYAPQSRTGAKLLAHELAHVSQRRGTAADTLVVQRAPAAGPEVRVPRAQTKDVADITGKVLQGNGHLVPFERLLSLTTDELEALLHNMDDALEAAQTEKDKLNVRHFLGILRQAIGVKDVRTTTEKADEKAERRQREEAPAEQEESEREIAPDPHKGGPPPLHGPVYKAAVLLHAPMVEAPAGVLTVAERFAVQAAKSGSAFTAGFSAGIGEIELTDEQKSRLRRNLALSSMLAPVVYLGMIKGISQETWDTLRGLPGAVEALKELLQSVLSPGGEAIAREIGMEAAHAVKADLEALIEMPAWEFSFELGERLGPILAEFALTFITAGGAAAVRGRKILELARKRRQRLEPRGEPPDGKLTRPAPDVAEPTSRSTSMDEEVPITIPPEAAASLKEPAVEWPDVPPRSVGAMGVPRAGRRRRPTFTNRQTVPETAPKQPPTELAETPANVPQQAPGSVLPDDYEPVTIQTPEALPTHVPKGKRARIIAEILEGRPRLTAAWARYEEILARGGRWEELGKDAKFVGTVQHKLMRKRVAKVAADEGFTVMDGVKLTPKLINELREKNAKVIITEAITRYGRRAGDYVSLDFERGEFHIGDLNPRAEPKHQRKIRRDLEMVQEQTGLKGTAAIEYYYVGAGGELLEDFTELAIK
jgi:hypothetical protein